jgi:2,3-bisphosphoglycerate-independent phosphoglycerate mutase
LKDEGTVTAAAAIAKVTRMTAYRERQRNEEFALAWADIEERVTEGLERKAVQMAMSGEVKLIEFLLKARRPERYRDNVKVEHSGGVEHKTRLVIPDGATDETIAASPPRSSTDSPTPASRRPTPASGSSPGAPSAFTHPTR